MSLKIEPPDIPNIINSYVNGVSENALAKSLNISRNVITRILRENGVNRRTRSEAETIKWSQMSPDKRSRQTRACHIAARGRKRTEEEMIKSAFTKEKTLSKVGKNELFIVDLLKQQGLNAIPQKAVGRYNIDIAIEPVAMELWLSPGNPLLPANNSGKTKYLTNLNWSVIWLWVGRGDILTERTIKDIALLINQIKGNKTLIGKYWVIRGGGNHIVSGDDFN